MTSEADSMRLMVIIRKGERGKAVVRTPNALCVSPVSSVLPSSAGFVLVLLSALAAACGRTCLPLKRELRFAEHVGWSLRRGVNLLYQPVGTNMTFCLCFLF